MRKELPDDVPVAHLPATSETLTVAKLLVLLGWAESNREAQRLVQQGAVKIDGARIEDPKHVEPVWSGKVIQKGNHQFAKLVAR